MFKRLRIYCAPLWLGPLLMLLQPPPIRSAEGGSSDRPPNVLLVLIDNIGTDWFGCYGSDERQTPHIDSLAAGGIRFADYYVTPLCSTTRHALLTGRYGFRTGWHTHHDTAIYGGGYFDWRREVTFARVLRSAGYATAISGKWQLNDFYDQTAAMTEHGFDEHLLWSGAMVGEGNAEQRWRHSLAHGRKLENRYADPILFRNGQRFQAHGKFGPQMYVEFLIDFMRRHRDQPFLAYYSTPLVHMPVVTTPLSPDENAPEREKFAGMVRYTDYQVGQLVQALDDLQLRDDTIVIVTTDNGSPSNLSGHVRGELVKGGLELMTEPGLDVPLIVNCPGRVRQGVVSDALVDCTDLFPTLVELAGASLPTGLTVDGRSFAGLLGSEDQSNGRTWIFSQYADTRVVRDHRYKLYSTGEFYDIEHDPDEEHNLNGSDDAEIVAAGQRLQQVLDGLPPNADLPFEPRSQSAFKMRGETEKLQSDRLQRN